MQATAPEQFRHTTLDKYPDTIVGVTLLDESPGFTGIYFRDLSGGLWPARTVNRTPAEHHREICEAWLCRPGTHEDKRTP